MAWSTKLSAHVCPQKALKYPCMGWWALALHVETYQGLRWAQTIHPPEAKVFMANDSVTGDNEKLLYCSFCGKSQNEVRKLIAGPSVFICDECVDLCNDIIREEVQEARGRPFLSATNVSICVTTLFVKKSRKPRLKPPASVCRFPMR